MPDLNPSVPIQVTTEFAATSPDVTRAIVQDLRTSERRYKVFEAVYSGARPPRMPAEEPPDVPLKMWFVRAGIFKMA